EIGVHIVHQLAERRRLTDRPSFDWIGIQNGGSDVAERLIHGVSPRVNYRRLLFPRDDNARTPMSLKVANQCPLPLVIAAGLRCSGDLQSQTFRYGFGEGLDIARAKRQP